MPPAGSPSPPAPRSHQARLPGLDALRAVAALSVVVMHVGAIWPGAPRMLGSAYLAVDFFFLLSGFVMARTYEDRMNREGLAPRRFLALRFQRLWPTMAVGAVLSLPFLWRDNPVAAVFVAAALPNFFLLPSFVTAELFPLNTPAWSIFFELFANLAHCAVLHRLRTRVLLCGAAVLFGVLALVGSHFGNLDLGARPSTFLVGFVRVGFSYALGVALWRWHADRPPLAIPLPLGLALMAALFYAADAFHLGGAAFDLAFLAVACPLLLWSGLSAGPRLAPVTTTACLVAGALSFPLYAVHYPVLLAAEAAGLPMLAGPVLALSVATLVAWRLGGVKHIAMFARAKASTS